MIIGKTWKPKSVIAAFRRIGFDLTNIMDGGEGVSPGYKQPRDVVEKRAAKLRGRKHPKEFGETISKALRGRADVHKICSNCGKSFTVTKSRNFRKFCSSTCSSEWKRDKPRGMRAP
jgi:hypothetical protein